MYVYSIGEMAYIGYLEDTKPIGNLNDILIEIDKIKDIRNLYQHDGTNWVLQSTADNKGGIDDDIRAIQSFKINPQLSAINSQLADKASLTIPNIFTKVPTIADPATPELHYGYEGFSGLRGWWCPGIDQAAAIPYRDFVTAAKGYAFNVRDGSISNGSNILTSIEANFNSNIAVGYSVSGIGIPVGTTIVSVTDSSHAVMSSTATATASNVNVFFSKTGASVNDLEYWSHNGFGAASVGFGYPQPPEDFRVRILSSLNNLNQGALKIHCNPGQLGDMLNINSLTTQNAFKVRSDGSVVITNSSNNNSPFLLQSDGSLPYINVYKPTDYSSFKLGIGIGVPSGKVHVQVSPTGQTPHINANTLILEANGNAGISVLSDKNSQGNIYFGDIDNALSGRLSYDHSKDSLNIWTGTNQRMVISSAGIGIGLVLNPTAALHLPAGDTGIGKVPLKLSSGGILSITEPGALEYDGTDLYFTNSTGTRKKITMS